MRDMLRTAAVALMVFLATSFVGCVDLDLTGINEGSEYIEELLDHTVVAQVVCPDSVPVGGSGQCMAFNSVGTQLASSGQTVVKWTAAPTASAQVDLAGLVYGGVPDVVTITAEGPKDSTASTQVTIF